MKRILQIGPIPEPKGGISIHIQRLSKYLSNEYEFIFVDESKVRKKGIFNIRSKNLFRYFSLIAKSNIVHIHSGSSILRDFHIVISKLLFKKTIVTMHGNNPLTNRLLNATDMFLLKSSNELIFVNDNISNKLNYKKPFKIKEAFLPPVIDDEPDLPEYLDEWLKMKKTEDKLITCANAWRLDTHEGGDLYGLDQIIKLADKLINEQNKMVAFVFNIAIIDNELEKFNNYKKQIKELKLEDSFLLMNDNISFVKLIVRSDFVLRPTLIDGDAVTIREALFLEKPIISSDAVERPQGTIIYQKGNVDDLYDKTLALIENRITIEEKKKVVLDDYLNFYRELYG